LTTALEGGEGSASRPGRSLPQAKTRYPLYRRLVGPHGRSGQVRKISTPLGFDPRTAQPVASRYTDYATRPTVYEIMWKNVVKPDRRLCIACSIPKATRRHSEYALLIALQQQWLHERASVLRCYVHCVSCSLLSAHDVTSLQTAILCAFTITAHYHSEWLSGLSQKWITEDLYEHLSTDYHFCL